MEIKRYNPKATLLASLSRDGLDPVDLVVYGAYATLKKEPSYILREMDDEDRRRARREKVLSVTLESGHLSVLDQAVFTVYISDIPRLATLYLVQPIYLSHLQQSMRRVEPYGYYIPRSIERFGWAIDLIHKSIDLYYEMVEDGVPKEDARYVIPLYTVTNIQTVGNAREYTHLKLLTSLEGAPTVVREIVEDIISEISKEAGELFKWRGENMNILKYYPAPNMFRFRRLSIDEYAESMSGPRLLSYSEVVRPSKEDLHKALSTKDYPYLTLLRNNTYNIVVKMSLSTLHQFLRQRTLHHVPESIYHALERRDYTIPPSIATAGYRDKFLEMVWNLHRAYHNLVREGVPREDAVGIVSHSHNIYDMVKVDGWNLIGSLPTRRCIKAQWEIRRVVGDIVNMVKKVNHAAALYTLPGCITFGECPEKYPCDYKEEFESRGPLVKG